MNKFKIIRNVLSFIALSRKNPTNETSPDGSPDLKRIMDPNNENLPEPNFLEFEKVNDFSQANHKKSMFNNQMSLLSNESSELLLKKSETERSFNNSTDDYSEFKIKVLPVQSSDKMPSKPSLVTTNLISSNNSSDPSKFRSQSVSNKKTSWAVDLVDNQNNNGCDSEEDEEEESQNDSIDVIEEEDEEEEEIKEVGLEIDTINDVNETVKEIEGIDNVEETNEEGGRRSIIKGVETEGAEEVVEEIETLEDELNPQMDVDLVMDVYEDKDNFDKGKKLRYFKDYKDHQWLLYPDDSFKSAWTLLLSFILGYTCVVTPYRVAFLSSEDDTETWLIIDWLTDSIFWLDILLNFISAFYDLNDNLIFSKKSIFYNYITGWFLFDTIGVLPFDYFFDVSRYGNLVRVTRLPKLYKLVRITKLIRVLKLVKERNTVIKYLMEVLSIGPGFERLFVSVLSIFAFCHLACCFWFMAGDLNEDPNNWVNQYNFQDSDNISIYVASFYWITQTVVTVGYGDIAAVNSLERAIACVYMFVGVFFYSFTIGSLSSLLSSMDSKNATFDQKLNTLIQIRNQYSLDNLLYNRVKRALKYGTAQRDDEKINFLNELPLNLRIELSVIMHKNLVSGIEFFRNKPIAFIALIGPFLKPFHIGENEYIFHEEEYADEMYFIKEGSVSMVLKEYSNFEYITIDKGYYFGEVDLLFGETRKFTYMACSDLELLSLSKKAFNKIFFNEFREIGSEIYKNAIKRRIRSNKTYKEAIEYCLKQAEKKKISPDRSGKSSFYGFRAQRSFAKKSSKTNRESEILFNKLTVQNNDSLLMAPDTIKKVLEPNPAEMIDVEEKAKLIESILEEKSGSLEGNIQGTDERIRMDTRNKEWSGTINVSTNKEVFKVQEPMEFLVTKEGTYDNIKEKGIRESPKRIDSKKETDNEGIKILKIFIIKSILFYKTTIFF